MPYSWAELFFPKSFGTNLKIKAETILQQTKNRYVLPVKFPECAFLNTAELNIHTGECRPNFLTAMCAFFSNKGNMVINIHLICTNI